MNGETGRPQRPDRSIVPTSGTTWRCRSSNSTRTRPGSVATSAFGMRDARSDELGLGWQRSSSGRGEETVQIVRARPGRRASLLPAPRAERLLLLLVSSHLRGWCRACPHRGSYDVSHRDTRPAHTSLGGTGRTATARNSHEPCWDRTSDPLLKRLVDSASAPMRPA